MICRQRRLCADVLQVLVTFSLPIRELASCSGLAPTYEAVCAEMGWPVDTAKLDAMRAVNTAKLEELDATIKDAEENMGDIELRDARLAKADYLCKLGAQGTRAHSLPRLALYILAGIQVEEARPYKLQQCPPCCGRAPVRTPTDIRPRCRQSMSIHSPPFCGVQAIAQQQSRHTQRRRRRRLAPA